MPKLFGYLEFGFQVPIIPCGLERGRLKPHPAMERSLKELLLSELKLDPSQWEEAGGGRGDPSNQHLEIDCLVSLTLYPYLSLQDQGSLYIC